MSKCLMSTNQDFTELATARTLIQRKLDEKDTDVLLHVFERVHRPEQR
jgi:hypothetical protein